MKAFVNAQIFTDNQLLDGFLTVQNNGKIALIGSKAQFAKHKLPQESEIIDCQQRLLLPGCVDTHVHFRDFEQEYKETLESGSQAALCGGVTTVLTMPNTKPPLTNPEILQKYQKLPRKLYCNIGIIAGVTEGFNCSEVPQFQKHGAFGIKIYPGSQSSNCPLEWDSQWLTTPLMPFPPQNISIEQVKTQILQIPPNWKNLFAVACQAHLPLLFHPEFPLPSSQLDKTYAELLEEAKKKPSIAHPELIAHDQTHSIANNEWVLIRMISAFMFAAKNQQLEIPHIHFCHVTNAESIRWIRQLQIAGYPVSSETTPHHIFLNNEMFYKNAAFAKVLDPLRAPQIQEALWEELQHETIDTIGTDHAPHSLEEKSTPFLQAPSGFPGLEIALSLFLTQMTNYRLALDKIMRLYAENPARIFHILGKGALHPGWDADLVLVERCPPYYWDAANSYSKAKWTPYIGTQLTVRIAQVYLKGQLAYDADRKLLNSCGEWLRKT